MFRLLFVYTTGLLLLLSATNVAGGPISFTAIKADQLSARADTFQMLQPRQVGRPSKHLYSANLKAEEAYKEAASTHRAAATLVNPNLNENRSKAHIDLADQLDAEARRFATDAQMHSENNPHSQASQDLNSYATVLKSTKRAQSITVNLLGEIEQLKAANAWAPLNRHLKDLHMKHADNFHDLANRLNPGHPIRVPDREIKLKDYQEFVQSSSNDAKESIKVATEAPLFKPAHH